jgi:2,4-dienoyl-CoA reductase-like NADH-dependent reductase (Old Yellow Enzyme family)
MGRGFQKVPIRRERKQQVIISRKGSKMPKLFESTAINSMRLKNRFVRSATFEGMADTDGACTPQLTNLMAELARGEVAVIITGHAYISQQGKARHGQLGVYADELIPGLAQMTDAVHKEGGKILMQIAHAGCNSSVIPAGEKAVGPSAMEMPQGCSCREMTKAEISETIEDFMQAAVRAKKSGFDGVQLHGAHGYFISQFLSPFYNKRADEYGGSLENRARVVLAVLRGIRSAVGDKFPVLIKINSDDFLEGGFTKNEMVQVAAMLEKEGIDAIEVSGGTHLSPDEYSFSRKTGVVSEDKELYFREAARLYKDKINVPLVLVGGIRSYSVAEQVVNEELADYISLCRPLIREPRLIRRWQSGDTSRAACISCNECFKPVRAAEEVYCVAEAKLRRKQAEHPF